MSDHGPYSDCQHDNFLKMLPDASRSRHPRPGLAPSASPVKRLMTQGLHKRVGSV
jgi:hypothetical protein